MRPALSEMATVSCVSSQARFGAIAQLGERLHGMQEVGGSIPPSSTKKAWCIRCSTLWAKLRMFKRVARMVRV